MLHPNFRLPLLWCILLFGGLHYFLMASESEAPAISWDNDTIVIDKVVNLNGQNVNLKENNVLRFTKNGLITNGTLTGNNSNIEASNALRIFSKIVIAGSWKVEKIYSKWMTFSTNALTNSTCLQNLCNLTSAQHQGTIYLSNRTFNVAVAENDAAVMTLNSNTNLVIDGLIKLKGNDFKFYNIVRIKNVENVKVSGGGSIQGDILTHTGTEGEWGMGIGIYSSKNITIQNLTITNCWGDCIYIGQTKIAPEHYSENVLIENVICKDGRRQGLSLTAGKDITIKDCTFEGTGTIKYTAPGAGVDIEPNIINAVIQNVTLENYKFLNNTNKPGDLRFFRINENCNVNVINCDFKDWVTFMKPSYNITFRNCTIPKIEPGKCDMSYIKFIDCQLGE